MLPTLGSGRVYGALMLKLFACTLVLNQVLEPCNLLFCGASNAPHAPCSIGMWLCE